MTTKPSGRLFSRLALGTAIVVTVLVLLPAVSARSNEPWTCRRENVHQLDMSPTQRRMADRGASNHDIVLQGTLERGPNTGIWWFLSDDGTAGAAAKTWEARQTHMRIR